MKTIESKDLVIGQEYYDIPDLDLEHATVFEFVEHYNSKDVFKYVKGAKSYDFDEQGYVYFFSPDRYYQP